MTITIEKTGRRYYLHGNTFPIKDQLREAGCKWDPDRKAWWTGKADVAESLKKRLADADEPAKSNGNRQGEGDDQVVAGRARYKGKTYYVAGRINRGRTRWDRDEVDFVETRDGAKLLLCFRDGSKTFWAARAAVEIVKTYRSPKTVGGLKQFADRAKSGEPQCAECGGFGDLVADLEDGQLKHVYCCDIPPSGC